MLTAIAKLATKDGSELPLLLDQVAAQLQYFKREASELLIRTIVLEGKREGAVCDVV